MNTTAFAVLGLLAVRDWTSYELAQQMQRSLRWIWPVSERSAYDQPHRLLEAGLARCETEHGPSGERQRFFITEAGREAVREWLRTHPEYVRSFNDVQLRVTFGDQGSVDDLLASLHYFRRSILERLPGGIERNEDRLATGGPFPDRLHLIAIVADLESRLTETYLDWVDDAIAEVERWDATNHGVERPAAVRSTLTQIVNRGRRRLTNPADSAQ